MSERQEEYNSKGKSDILDQAAQVAGQHEAELDKMEAAILGQQIRKTLEQVRKLAQEVVPKTPIHAVLMAKLGPHWQHAHICSYEFPGEIKLHIAQCRVIVSGCNMIFCELVYQLGEVCSVLEKSREGD